GHPPDAHQDPPRVDQWLRGAPAANDSHRALAGGLPAPLLHLPLRPGPQPSRLHSILQLLPASSWLFSPWPERSDVLPRCRRGRAVTACPTLGTAKVSTPTRVWTT